jgi:hypothetical protein
MVELFCVDMTKVRDRSPTPEIDCVFIIVSSDESMLVKLTLAENCDDIECAKLSLGSKEIVVDPSIVKMVELVLFSATVDVKPLAMGRLFTRLLETVNFVADGMELLKAESIMVLERSVGLTEELVTTTAGAATLCAFSIRGFGGGTIVVAIIVDSRVEVETTIRLEDGRGRTADIELNRRLDALSRLICCGMGTSVAEN